MNCPKCETVLTDDAKFCTNCGSATQTICPKCGSVLSESAKFCSGCGTSTQTSTAASLSKVQNLDKTNLTKINEQPQLVTEANKGRFIWSTSSARDAVNKLVGITPKRFYENGFYSSDKFYPYEEVSGIAIQSTVYKALFVSAHTTSALFIKTSDGIEHHAYETAVLKGEPTAGFSEVHDIINKRILERMGKEIDEKGQTEWADSCFLTSHGIMQITQMTADGLKLIPYGEVTSISLPSVAVAGVLASGCVIKGADGTVIKVGTTYNRIPVYCLLSVLCPHLGLR